MTGVTGRFVDFLALERNIVAVSGAMFLMDLGRSNIVGVSAADFGALVGVQTATAILVYLPAARLADRLGRKPFVIATFLAFAAFPVAVVTASGMAGLMLAFVIGGLREIGEPARKALIVDFAEPHLRARSVGLYYLIRSLAITPAAFVGGLLWEVAPSAPFCRRDRRGRYASLRGHG